LVIVIAIPGMLGDRYTFQASFGFSIFLAGCLFYFYSLPAGSFLNSFVNSKTIKQASKILFVLLLLGYTSLSVARNSQWKDSIALMRHDINAVPESVQAHNLLAINLVNRSFIATNPADQKQLREEALEHLKRAHSYYPDYFNFSYDIGRIFLLLNNPDSALIYFKEAYTLNPDFTDVPVNIANIYFNRNDFEASIPYYIKVIHNNADDYTAYDRLSYAYFRTNQPELSVRTNMDAINRAPSRPQPYINIGLCYFNTNKQDSAKIWFDKAMILEPNNPMLRDYLQKLK
jgi:tetratricopeptide (TPR) repeat protein